MTSIQTGTTTITVDLGINFLVEQLRGSLRATRAAQATCQLRACYLATGAKVSKNLRKMNSVRLARKFEKTTGYAGCFNPWDVTSDERYEMIRTLWIRQMEVIFGDYVMAPSAGVLASSLDRVLGVKPPQTGRFTEAEVIAIRVERLQNGTSFRKIGKQYGVSGDMIRSIVIGECYTDVAMNLIEG
jgi:hypothetical protein